MGKTTKWRKPLTSLAACDGVMARLPALDPGLEYRRDGKIEPLDTFLGLRRKLPARIGGSGTGRFDSWPFFMYTAPSVSTKDNGYIFHKEQGQDRNLQCAPNPTGTAETLHADTNPIDNFRGSALEKFNPLTTRCASSEQETISCRPA
jgi:hypothetical protein